MSQDCSSEAHLRPAVRPEVRCCKVDVGALVVGYEVLACGVAAQWSRIWACMPVGRGCGNCNGVGSCDACLLRPGRAVRRLRVELSVAGGVWTEEALLTNSDLCSTRTVWNEAWLLTGGRDRACMQCNSSWQLAMLATNAPHIPTMPKVTRHPLESVCRASNSIGCHTSLQALRRVLTMWLGSRLLK